MIINWNVESWYNQGYYLGMLNIDYGICKEDGLFYKKKYTTFSSENIVSFAMCNSRENEGTRYI